MAMLCSDPEKNQCQTDLASVRLAEALLLLYLVCAAFAVNTEQGGGAQHQGCESGF